MTNTNTKTDPKATYGIVTNLILAADRIRTAARPIDRRLAKAEILGLSTAAYYLAWGMTPFAIEIAALDAVDANGPMPGQTSDNTARKEWFAKAEDHIIEALGL